MKQSLNATINLIKNYSWSSIFFKYWKKLAIIIMVPFLMINSIVYFFYSEIVDKEILSSASQDFPKIVNTVNNLFDEINKNFVLFHSNESVKAFISTSNFSSSKYATINVNNIRSLMMNFINTSTYINSIHIYSTANNYVVSSKNGNFIDDFYDKGWYDEYIKTGKTNFIVPTITYTDNKSNKNLSVCYGIIDNKVLSGIIIFNIDTDNLNKLLLTNNSDELLLLNNDGYIFHSNNPDKINQKFDKFDKYNDLTKKEIHTERGKTSVLFSSPIDTQDILIFCTVGLDRFETNMNKVRTVFIVCFLIALLLPICISLYISMQFYNSIAKIAVEFNLPQYNNDDDNKDELVFISKNIMSIMNKNALIENELINKIATIKKAQSMALQTQFNPHFLFNTLNHISLIMINLTGGNNSASKMISLLSDLLTSSLNTKEYIIAVKDEILYAEKYIEIEAIKYKNNFDILWNIDDNTLQLKIIKFILQPIIENAFNHGIRMLRKKRRGKIIISSYIKNENLIFEIEDNGLGMTPQKLEDVQKTLNTNDLPDTKHIGLCNVNQRIKLIFGEDYGCYIDSNENGTTVQIILPKVTDLNSP